MPVFVYILRDTGQSVTHTIEADSFDAAREILRREHPGFYELKQISEAPLTPLPLADLFRATAEEQPPTYYPLIDTLRLYAGWLLAWYVVIYALGGYLFLRPLPLHIPFVKDLLGSPLIIRVACGLFLFLLLSSLHRALRANVLVAVVFAFVWLALIAYASINL